MAQNIDLPRSIAIEILDLENPRFSFFKGFRQNGGQNYSRFRFSVPIRVLHPRLGRSSPKSQKNSKGHFFEKFGVKSSSVQKLFKRVTNNFHSRLFDILWVPRPSIAVPNLVRIR